MPINFGAIFISIVLLCIMEVSLSFDNAAMNATVLRKMSEKWQRVFLSWGLLISVFVVRLILPAMIISISTHLDLPQIFRLALDAPAQYAAYITTARPLIGSFGGAFLLLVFLSFLFDANKDTHWITPVERFAARFSPTDLIQKNVCIISMVVFTLLFFNAPLLPALLGIVTFIFLEQLKTGIEKENSNLPVASGLAWFLHLEVLDASFSLDGVVGAFAISSNIISIMIGLGIGSLVIRSLTIYMVRRKTLDALIYLEHGAHYSIGALGLLMLIENRLHVPELVTGVIGVMIILLAVISSEMKQYARA